MGGLLRVFNSINYRFDEFNEYLITLKNGINSSERIRKYKNSYIDVIDNLNNSCPEYINDYDDFIANSNQSNIINIEIFDSIHDNNLDIIWKDIKYLMKELNLRDEIENSCNIFGVYTCPACGLSIGANDSNYRMTIDHVIPKSKFNQYLLYPKNLIPMCWTCNKNKNDIIEEHIFHPIYSGYDLKPKDSITVELVTRNRRGKTDINLKYIFSKTEENYIQVRENYNNIFNLNKTYNKRIFKKLIMDRYTPLTNTFKNQPRERLRTRLIKDLEERIRKLTNLSYQDDGDELEYLSLLKLLENIDVFLDYLVG